MANHYRVSPKYWLHARKHGWTDAQTALGLYLLTCEHRNLEGLYRLPKPYIGADLDWPARKVSETLASLVAAGFVQYDEAAMMVLIPKALKHQAPSTDKQVLGAIAALRRTPRTELWPAFVESCDRYCPKLASAVRVTWPDSPECDPNAITVALPCDSGTRAGPNSSSSSKEDPPDPPQAGGQESPASYSAKVARARNGSGRQRDLRALKIEEERQAASLAPPAPGDGEAWERCRDSLRSLVPESAFAQWFEPVEVVARDGDVLVLDGPTFRRYHAMVVQAARDAGLSVRVATSAELQAVRSGVAA